MNDEMIPIERLKQVVSALFAVPKSALSSPFFRQKKGDEKSRKTDSKNDIAKSRKKSSL